MRIETKRTIFGDTRLVATVVASVVAAAGFLGSSSLASAAADIDYQDKPLVASEWQVDRTAPSGGWAIEDFDSREALRMSVDTSQQSDMGAFYHTEGLKTSFDGLGVSADVYVDSDWRTTEMRAGIWPVGHDASGNVSAYPIIEYTTMGEEAFTGWRIWDGVSGGWTNLDELVVDGWNDLAVELNLETNQFDYFINGELVASNDAGDSATIGDVIFNNYNNGSDSASYDVYWSNLEVGQLATDSQAPDVTISNPLDGAVVQGDLTLSTLVSDDNELLRYYYFVKAPGGEYVVGPEKVSTSEATVNFSENVDTTTWADGDYVFQMEARDAAGNKDEGSTARVSSSVDNVVDAKDDCKQGGWMTYLRADGSSFKNQGQCVAYTTSSNNSKHHRN